MLWSCPTICQPVHLSKCWVHDKHVCIVLDFHAVLHVCFSVYLSIHAQWHVCLILTLYTCESRFKGYTDSAVKMHSQLHCTWPFNWTWLVVASDCCRTLWTLFGLDRGQFPIHPRLRWLSAVFGLLEGAGTIGIPGVNTRRLFSFGVSNRSGRNLFLHWSYRVVDNSGDGTQFVETESMATKRTCILAFVGAEWFDYFTRRSGDRRLVP